MFKKSDLLRILPDSVLRDLKRAPDVKLETTSYDDLLKTVTQLVKDNNNAPVAMDLDELMWRQETSKELSQESDSEHFHWDAHGEGEPTDTYGQDGYLYYLDNKGKGKGKGKSKGEGAKGGGFQGECSWCGKYGHRLRECRNYTNHLQSGGAPIGAKGKGKIGWNKGGHIKGDYSGWMTKGAEKGKAGGKSWGHKPGKGGYANYVGNEYAPTPTPAHQLNQSACQQLMTAPWNQEFVETLCQLKTQNRFAALDLDEVEYPSLSEANRVTSREIEGEKIKVGKKKTKNLQSNLECLLIESMDTSGTLNRFEQTDWEKVSFTVDSGASETVANSAKFVGFDAYETSATGTQYSSAGCGGPSIVNTGEKRIEVMNENGEMNYMKVQMCDNLNTKKLLASVSRLNQAGHRVVFDEPQSGSYIENKATGKKTWLRQEGGVFYLDLWVNPEPSFGRQGASGN